MAMLKNDDDLKRIADLEAALLEIAEADIYASGLVAFARKKCRELGLQPRP